VLHRGSIKEVVMAVRIGVVGAAGRMGRMLIREIAATEGAAFAGATEQAGHSDIGRDAAALAGLAPGGAKIGDDAAPLFAACDAVLDFTSPAATVAHAALAAQARIVHVIGTTGIDAQQTEAIKRAAKHTPIVWGANMSVGVNLLAALTRQVAKTLGPDWDIEIVEMHHKHKVDAPSGTALALGHAAAEGRDVALDKVSARGRDGHTGARTKGDIGFASLRGGDVVGDHVVVFAGTAERIELGHRAAGREIYARGAVRAALWAKGKPPGLYSMADVLGLG
jgi:4-hydroxy-tetrahydrodipicolinate reductase